MNAIETCIRERVWLEAWLATMKIQTSSSVHKSENATYHADKCLEDFDKRFPNWPKTST